MRSLVNNILVILIFTLGSACVSHNKMQSNLPSAGKQCKVMLNKKYAKISSRKSKVNTEEPVKAQEQLQASLMTDEQYLEQIAKVKKSIKKFDVDKDCPPALKKPTTKKKRKLRSFIRKNF